MANIVSFEKQASYGKRKNAVVDVKCIYEKGYLSNGRPCVILKTYNPTSQNQGISQTLHLTKETAVELIEILKKELSL